MGAPSVRTRSCPQQRPGEVTPSREPPNLLLPARPRRRSGGGPAATLQPAWEPAATGSLPKTVVPRRPGALAPQRVDDLRGHVTASAILGPPGRQPPRWHESEPHCQRLTVPPPASRSHKLEPHCQRLTVPPPSRTVIDAVGPGHASIHTGRTEVVGGGTVRGDRRRDAVVCQRPSPPGRTRNPRRTPRKPARGITRYPRGRRPGRWELGPGPASAFQGRAA